MGGHHGYYYTVVPGGTYHVLGEPVHDSPAPTNGEGSSKRDVVHDHEALKVDPLPQSRRVHTRIPLSGQVAKVRVDVGQVRQLVLSEGQPCEVAGTPALECKRTRRAHKHTRMCKHCEGAVTVRSDTA